MADIPANSEPVPGTPGIREVRSDTGAEGFGFCPPQNAGTRKVGLRAEIDTSPPFGSVQEAVTRFGGRGSWMPYYKGFEEIDIKKVEEQAAELEKDLIVKELETLDVLEELGTTKRIVEELKLQLQKEALRCMANPDDHLSSPAAIKEMNKENCTLLPSPRPCPASSPDAILMELKQAKFNLGLLSLEEPVEKIEVPKETLVNVQDKTSALKTAELRLFAAKKMEEAARASEAVALAEIKALSIANEASSGFVLPEPEKVGSFDCQSPFFSFDARSPLASLEARSPLATKGPCPEEFAKEVEDNKPQKREPNAANMSLLKKLREATEEVKQSKQALEDALNKIEMANRKQSAAEEAFRKWLPDNDEESQETKGSNLVPDEPKPVLRTTVSMRDVLSRKQVQPEDLAMGRPVEAREERQKVALSQMLHELREDLTFHPRVEKLGGGQKQLIAQRRKFGFIHISLPMSKPSKKKAQDFNNQIH